MGKDNERGTKLRIETYLNQRNYASAISLIECLNNKDEANKYLKRIASYLMRERFLWMKQDKLCLLKKVFCLLPEDENKIELAKKAIDYLLEDSHVISYEDENPFIANYFLSFISNSKEKTEYLKRISDYSKRLIKSFIKRQPAACSAHEHAMEADKYLDLILDDDKEKINLLESIFQIYVRVGDAEKIKKMEKILNDIG